MISLICIDGLTCTIQERKNGNTIFRNYFEYACVIGGFHSRSYPTEFLSPAEVSDHKTVPVSIDHFFYSLCTQFYMSNISIHQRRFIVIIKSLLVDVQSTKKKVAARRWEGRKAVANFKMPPNWRRWLDSMEWPNNYRSNCWFPCVMEQYRYRLVEYWFSFASNRAAFVCVLFNNILLAFIYEWQLIPHLRSCA